MSDLTISYLLYLAIAVPLTLAVGRTLSRHGRVFLAEVAGDEAVARATNSLLVVGFYLVNVGFVVWFLRSDAPVVGAAGVLEALSLKIGVVLLVVGVLHFLNLFVLLGIRNGRRDRQIAAARVGAMQHPAAWSTPMPAGHHGHPGAGR